MIRVCCDVCRRDLSHPHATAGNFAFCERCVTWGDEYMKEVTRIGAEGMMEIGRKIERFRSQFVKDRIAQQRPEIKVVGA